MPVFQNHPALSQRAFAYEPGLSFTNMKKIIFLIVACCFANGSFAQDSTRTPFIETDYLKQSKRQKTAAWILTGVGTAGLLTTLTADASQSVGGAFVTLISFGSVEPEYKSYTAPYILSSVALVCGITLFIASARSKRKMKNLSGFMHMEKVSVLRHNGLQQQSIPVAGIQVQL